MYTAVHFCLPKSVSDTSFRTEVVPWALRVALVRNGELAPYPRDESSAQPTQTKSRVPAEAVGHIASA